MQPAGRPLISSVAAGTGGMALAAIGAPWWLTAVAFGCFALGLLVLAIQSVFPQESEHRLDWWRDRRRHQQIRHQAALHAHRPGDRAHDEEDATSPHRPHGRDQ